MTKILKIKVKTQSRISQLAASDEGIWLAQLKSPPVDGEANKELIGLVAKHMGCRKADVSIMSGLASRLKLVKIQGLD